MIYIVLVNKYYLKIFTISIDNYIYEFNFYIYFIITRNATIITSN